jgi:Protein of unknown function (DUF2953).
MAAVLICILWILAVLALILLIAPVDFSLEGELAESPNFQGRVRWVGGILSLNVIRRQGKNETVWGILGFAKQNPDRREKESGKPKKDGKDKHEDTTKRRKKSTTGITAFLNLEFFMAVKKGFYKLVHSLHLKINLSGVYGFDDPSLTGIVMGLAYALKIKNSSINIKPDFTREVVDLRGRFQGWFVPLQIIFTALGILLMKPVRAIWWPKIKFRKKQKEAVKYA